MIYEYLTEDASYDASNISLESMSYGMNDNVSSMFETISLVDNACNIADVMVSTKFVVEGAVDVSVMEGVFSDAIDKLKAGFIKLKNAIVAWFKKVVLFFQSMFKNGKKFVDAYGDTLRSKSTDGFEYTGFEWNIEKGDSVVKTITDSIDGKISSRMKGMTISDRASTKSDTFDSQSGDDSDRDASGITDDIVTSISGDFNTLQEMKDNIEVTYRGGKTTMTTDNTLNSSKVSTYLKFIETGKNAISDMKEEQKVFENKINAIIRQLDNAKAELNKETDESKKDTKNISRLTFGSKYLTACINIRKSAIDRKVFMYRTMLVGVTAVLKKFLRWGGKKEPVTNSAYEIEYDRISTMEGVAMLLEAATIDNDDFDDSELNESTLENTGYEEPDTTGRSELFSKIYGNF